MMKCANSLSFLVIFALIVQNYGISDKRLCVDEKCVEVISLGKTVKSYMPHQEGVLPFKFGTEVKIKSKTTSKSESELLGVEIDGKDGYAPSMFIKEYKVLHTFDSLIEGKPKVQPPKRKKSKLKSSEKEAPEVKVTTTAPLPINEMVSEKIVTDVGEKQAVQENLVNVTPSQTIEVVDGTEIPLEAEPVETKGEVKLGNKSASDEDFVEDDEDDEEDEDDDDEDEGFFDEEIIEDVPENPSELKVENISKEKKTGEEKKEGNQTVNPIVVENEHSSQETKAEPEVESRPIQVSLKEVGTEGAASQVELLIIKNETDSTEAVTKQDLEPSSPEFSGTKSNETEIKTTEVVNSDAQTSEEPSEPTQLQGKVEPAVEKPGVEDKPTEVLETNSSTSENEVSPKEELTKSEQMPKPVEQLEIEAGPEALTNAEINLSQKKSESAEYITESEVYSEKHKEDAKPESSDGKSAEPSVEPIGKSESAEDVIPSETQSETPKHDSVDEKVAEPIVKQSNELIDQQKEELNSTESVKDATNVTDVFTATEPGIEGTQNAIEGTIPNHDVLKKQTSEIPLTILGKESTQAGDLHPQENDKGSAEVESNPEAKSTPTVPIYAPTVADLNTVNDLNLNIQPVVESPATIPSQPELNSVKALGAETEQPAITIPTDISEPKLDEAQAVNVPNVVPPKDVINELPLVFSNKVPKSAETQLPNQDKHSAFTNKNDVPSENVDVTEVPPIPAPTQPEIEDLIDNPFDFDVTTPNPVPSIPAPKALPIQPPQQQVGLFQTILSTVKGFLPSQEPSHSTEFSDQLNRILFPKNEPNHAQKQAIPEEYCEKDTNCPPSYHNDGHHEEKDFIGSLSDKVLELFDLLSCMVISAAATLLFTFGYYCISQWRKEHELIAKLNVVERSLLASNKEASILKHDLGETCDKLASIENNSFGSNDMVIAIKKDLEDSEEAKARLEEQVISLEKELENAAEAGLELNKIVSELLNNQSGDESIISSVEELQRQLNEQQHTILEINAILADKSRENSELQLILAEQNAKFGGEIASLQQDNDELEAEKNALKSKMDEMKAEFELDITKALEGKNAEIKRLQADIVGLRTKYEEEHRKWQTSVAKIEALEDCLKTVKRDPSVNVSQIIDVANVQAELLDIKRQRTSLKEKLEFEMDTRKLLEDQVKSFSEEIEKLKQDFHQSEKDKLEAQTRLEVLSNYFKDKENQLQKELSLKEAMWLKQQGETTSTVDRLTSMQEEIQTLKSQNDSLRAEIEAQLAAHKAQIGTLENRAHETWLAARQSERKYEEARSDATALRRKLTALVGNNTQHLTKENNLDVNHPPSDINNAPSPVHMESPGSPILGRLPLPPFMPPSLIGPPPPHFMGMLPFMPPGEMRPPPMGRLMSPPPPPGAPHLHRYSPIDDDDDEDEIRENSRGHWRDSYSPPRHSYRYSPDRYIYNPDLISNYDTETDFSPPPSPRERSHRSGSRSGSYKAYSPPPQSANSQSMDRPKKSSKGQMSSGSEKSYNSWKGKSKAMV